MDGIESPDIRLCAVLHWSSHTLQVEASDRMRIDRRRSRARSLPTLRMTTIKLLPIWIGGARRRTRRAGDCFLLNLLYSNVLHDRRLVPCFSFSPSKWLWSTSSAVHAHCEWRERTRWKRATRKRKVMPNERERWVTGAAPDRVTSDKVMADSGCSRPTWRAAEGHRGPDRQQVAQVRAKAEESLASVKAASPTCSMRRWRKPA